MLTYIVTRMKIRNISLYLLICIVFASCSFNYNLAVAEPDDLPEIVLTEVRAQRFEDSKISYDLRASTLEMYKESDVWLAQDVFFIGYKTDTENQVETQGFTKLLYVDEHNDTYYLGKEATITIEEEEITINSQDLKYSKKQNSLQSTKDSFVSITKTNGTFITGKGFYANLLSHTYHFEDSVRGTFIVEDSDSQEESVEKPAGESAGKPEEEKNHE